MKIHCSFCNSSVQDCKTIVQSNLKDTQAAICDKCVADCVEAIGTDVIISNMKENEARRNAYQDFTHH